MVTLTPVSFANPRGHAPRLSKKYVPGRHAETYWRAEEDAIVRAHYPKGGAKACLPHLPRRNIRSVYQRAKKLGLSTTHTGRRDGRRARGALLSPEMDATIRDRWPSLVGRGAVSRFADEIDVPRWWLSARGLCISRCRTKRSRPGPRPRTR